MNEMMRQAIERGELVLFLGAGASRGCKSSRGKDTLDGQGLAVELANRASLPYDSEPLDEVYSAARQVLQARLDAVFEELFRHSQPSHEYLEIARFPWRRIYSLNIDDALDRALHLKSPQRVKARLSTDPIEDRDPFFEILDYVKLNGSVDRLGEGIIFSASEYAKATATARPWYEQCASDFIRSPFLFVGTKLNEPLLKFHIERYKLLNDKKPGRSYVITPSATEIQVKSLLQYNIVHIAGTLQTFTNWLKSTFPSGVTAEEMAMASMPQYKGYLEADDKLAYASLLDGVTAVERGMQSTVNGSDMIGSVRTFYKGFRPTWRDIVEEIPARLEVLDSSLRLLKDPSLKEPVIPFVGPAGSGKSTLLMQIAYEMAIDLNLDVYFIDELPSALGKTLEALEKNTPKDGQVLVAIDNVEFLVDQLADVLSSGRLKRTRIICATRENVWAKRVRIKLGQFARTPVFVREFTPADAARILEKLKLYGSWTVLGQLTRQAQIDALVVRSKQQLLIALLEATYGHGFHEIIENDYATVTTTEERIFLLTVGIITDRSFDAPTSLVDRALSSLGVLSSAVVLAGGLAGIVVERNGKLSVRHQVYVRHLLDHVVDPELTAVAVDGLLQAFSHYSAPIIKHLDKSDAAIYKGIINHRFLWEILKGRETLIIPLYKKLEKLFELDGLFWLQYGLSLRDFHNSKEALTKLRTAYAAYPADHTQHALGHQLLILANEATEKTTAMAYVDEARGLLEPLDDVIDSDDTYPIITLAEGHTRLARKLQTEADARAVAKSYVAALKRRSESQPDNRRLLACYEKLFRFVATGTWME